MITVNHRCTCGPREFVPDDGGLCYRCQGIAPPKCFRCFKVLTDEEVAGGICTTCGALQPEAKS